MAKFNYSFSSLWNRFLLIIAIPIILLQIVTVCIFYVRHWSHVNDHMHNSLINEIKWIITEVDDIDKSVTKDTTSNSKKLLLRNEMRKLAYKKFSSIFQIYVTNASTSFTGNKLIAKKNTDSNLKDLASELSHIIRHNIFDMQYINNKSKVQCIVQLADDDFLRVEFNSTRIRSGTTRIFVLWIIGSALLLFGVAWVFAKNQIRSIVGFTNAVQNWSDCDNITFIPSGPKEIIAAGNSFLQMKKRLEENVKERAKFLTYVAHDMRTPLTRMKLQIAVFVDTINTKKVRNLKNANTGAYSNSDQKQFISTINKNIVELELLLNYYLDFVKNGEIESYVETDISKIIISSIQKFSDRRIKFINTYNDDTKRAKKKSHYRVRIQVNSIERALHNIIGNALKFAADQIMITLSFVKNKLVIKIEDDGPGMDKKMYHDAFVAFTRNIHQEESLKKMHDIGAMYDKSSPHNISISSSLHKKQSKNSSNIPSFGLGLSIAKDIIINNNGTIKFDKSHLGGLCVIVSFSII